MTDDWYLLWTSQESRFRINVPQEENRFAVASDPQASGIDRMLRLKPAVVLVAQPLLFQDRLTDFEFVLAHVAAEFDVFRFQIAIEAGCEPVVPVLVSSFSFDWWQPLQRTAWRCNHLQPAESQVAR